MVDFDFLGSPTNSPQGISVRFLCERLTSPGSMPNTLETACVLINDLDQGSTSAPLSDSWDWFALNRIPRFHLDQGSALASCCSLFSSGGWALPICSYLCRKMESFPWIQSIDVTEDMIQSMKEDEKGMIWNDEAWQKGG